MTKRFLPFLVLTVLTCLSISGFAQIRYFDDVFPAVTRVNSIMYDFLFIKCHIHSKFRDEYAFELIYFLKNVYINY